VIGRTGDFIEDDAAGDLLGPPQFCGLRAVQRGMPRVQMARIAKTRAQTPANKPIPQASGSPQRGAESPRHPRDQANPRACRQPKLSNPSERDSVGWFPSFLARRHGHKGLWRSTPITRVKAGLRIGSDLEALPSYNSLTVSQQSRQLR